jgi:tetratricopeptide (TPR) repeat protein
MALSDFIEHYDSTWDALMQEQDKFPLQEYSDTTVWTTWKMSYDQVVCQSEEAAGLLKLWAFLDRGDLWYELVVPALKLNFDLAIEAPGWLLRMAKNRLKFSSAIAILSRYSLIDSREETSSHSMHAVLHKWCYQLSMGSEREELFLVAIGIVALAVPFKSDNEYWVLERRLLPHSVQIYQWHLRDKWFQLDQVSNPYQGWMFSRLGALYDDQGKLVEAEQMYERALQGKEKARGPEHTSTLSIVNNLGNLYALQGKLVEAKQMYERALQGKEKAWGPEHTLTLNTVNNLGNLYARQGKLVDAEQLYERALLGYKKVFGPNHPRCRTIWDYLQALNGIIVTES